MIRHTVLGILSFAAACRCGADLALVRGGSPVACIVVPADAGDAVTRAADELNLYLRRMSGTELPVVKTAPPDAPAVYLGAPDSRWAADAKLSSLTFDGFVVEVTDKGLVLAGNVPEGTLNAVYWLLERLGVRWFIPTELGENVPRMDTVGMPEIRERVEPRFPCRKNHGIDRSIRGHGATWRRRIRITSHDVNVPFNRYSHNLANIVRIGEHAESHPEYFPLIDGKRRIPDKSHGWQPCTSNPEVVKLAVEAAHAWWKAHPDANCFSVGMNDGRGWCECDACTAMDIPGYTFRGRPVKSERYFTFVKQVAEAVRESHPGKVISCIAYSSVEPLPRGIELPDNVLVVITQDVGAWHDPAYRAEDEALAKAWSKAAGAFGVYNYTSEMWLLPRVYPHLMAEALRFYDDLGAVAVTNESWPTWWYAGPMMYLRAKLMWDPKQDADAILDEYYNGFFGPAAPPMKRLYSRFEACMLKEREGKWFFGINSVPDQIGLWTPGDLDACLAALAAAAKTATSSPFRERVAFVARGFASTEAVLREYWEGERLRLHAETGAWSADELLEGIGRFLRLRERRKAVIADVMESELLAGIYDRLLNERPHRLNSWHSDLDTALMAGVGALIGTGETLPPERVSALADAGGEQTQRLLRALPWLQQNPDAPNLCPNPGFEEQDGQTPEGIGWTRIGAPPAWATWSIAGDTGQCRWEAAGGRSEPRCATITGAKLSTFIAKVPVTPDQTYFVAIWARKKGSETQIPRLAVKWQDAEGKWTAQRANADISMAGGAGGDRWRRLATVVQVPEGARRLLVMPRALNQQPADSVVFDDARVVLLPEEH